MTDAGGIRHDEGEAKMPTDFADMTLEEMQAAGAAGVAERRRLFEETPDRKAAEEAELERLVDLVEDIAWETRMRRFAVIPAKKIVATLCSAICIQLGFEVYTDIDGALSIDVDPDAEDEDASQWRSAHRLSVTLRAPSLAMAELRQLGGIGSPTAYFTIDAPWVIPALLSKVKIVGPVLEPAAGAGHLVRELRRGYGLEVIASDLHAYEEPLIPDIVICDLRSLALNGFQWVITNLPYQEQDKLAAHLVALGAREGCSIALLTRAEWIVAGSLTSPRHISTLPIPALFAKGRAASALAIRLPAFRTCCQGIAISLISAVRPTATSAVVILDVRLTAIPAVR
jgi:hypothetical protein